jgi:outer membrane lipoprotein-sorting protein
MNVFLNKRLYFSPPEASERLPFMLDEDTFETVLFKKVISNSGQMM